MAARPSDNGRVRMSVSLGWISADLEVLPDDGTRYEMIDGELCVSRLSHWNHQAVSGQCARCSSSRACRPAPGRPASSSG